MKKRIILYLLLSWSSIVSAQIIGGGGIIKTAGNPNSLAILNVINQVKDGSVAVDTSAGMLYIYDVSKSIGSRWRSLTSYDLWSNIAGRPSTANQIVYGDGLQSANLSFTGSNTLILGSSSVTSSKFLIDRTNAGTNSSYSILLSSPNSPTINIGYGADFTGERSGTVDITNAMYQWFVPSANQMQFGRLNKTAGTAFTSADEIPYLTLGNSGHTFHQTLSMNNTKITSLANGTASTDAVNLGQLQAINGSWITSGTIPDARLSTTISQQAGNWGQMDAHGTFTDFNAVTRIGASYVQSSTNAPTWLGSAQGYQQIQALGSNYDWSGSMATSYAQQTVIGRNSSTPYYSVRWKEGGTWGAWQKIWAGNSDNLNGQSPAYYLNATNISNGTLADARLSSNIPLKGNASNVFQNTTTNSNSNITVQGNGTGQGTLTVSDGTGTNTIQLLANGALAAFTSSNNISLRAAASSIIQFVVNSVEYARVNSDGALLVGTTGSNGVDKIQSSGSILGTVLKSNVATGTAPLSIVSTTRVNNLNTQFISGLDTTILAQRNQVNTFTQRNNFTNFVSITGASAIAAADHTNYTDGTDRIYTMQGDGNVRSSTYQALINANQANDTFAMTTPAQTFTLSSNLVNTVDVGLHASTFDSLDIRLPATIFDDNQRLSITTSNKRMIVSQGDKIKITSSSGVTLLEIVNDVNSILSAPYEINTSVLGYIDLVIQYSKKRNKWRIISFNNWIDQ